MVEVLFRLIFVLLVGLGLGFSLFVLCVSVCLF